MLRISADKAPRELELPMGVTVTVRPAATDMMLDVFADLNAQGFELGDMSPERRTALAKALARRAIIEWSGVIDDATGKPAPITPEFIDAVLDDFRIFGAFEAQYVLPLLSLVQEKNGSRPSPTGGSAGAGTTAARAKRGAKTALKTTSRPRASKEK